MTPRQAIAHYTITSKLGEGGMGTVYRATDTKLNREVAIKVLPDAFAADPDRLARFTREAQVLASLNHPNIASIYGVEDRALVMELVEGEPLKGPLPWEAALDCARQIADALEYAHDKGIVHRDLKPANILITPGGTIKLLDFGLAKAMFSEQAPGDPEASPTLTFSPTTAGFILGTAGYMSPEQAKGKAVDRRADIWAFGVVLWELLTGRRLFEGETVSEAIAQVLAKEPDWTQAPAPARRLLRSCLQRDPKARLKSIGDWRLLLDEGGAAASGPVRANRLPWAAAVAAMLLAAVFGWAWLRRDAPATAGAYQLDVLPPDGETVYQDALGGYQAISPDGRTLAFISEGNGARHILVRPLDSPTSRALAGTELADGLFWSPDSRHVGFTAGSKLERVDLGTGTVKEICDGFASLRGATWNADGTIVFGAAGIPLRKVPAEGGTPVPVLAYEKGEAGHLFPQFLPDGKHFLFWVRGGQGRLTGVYAGSIDRPPNQERRQILAGPTAARYAPSTGSKEGYLLFLRERTLLAQPFDAERLTLSGSARSVAENVGSRAELGQFLPSQNGILSTATAGNLFRTVTVVSRDGKTIATVGAPGAFSAIRLSPDGRSAAVIEVLSPAMEIAILDMTHGRPVQFTSEGGLSLFPVWSPDGKEILFSSLRGEMYRLYRKAISGKEQEIPTGPNLAAIAAAWLHDPERVVYIEPISPSLLRLMMRPLAPEGTPAPLFDSSRGRMYSFSVSRSQRWVAYTSEESGRPEVYVRSMPRQGEPAGPAIRISTGAGRDPAWSDDEKELFFGTLDDRLMAASVKETEGRLDAAEPKRLFDLGATSTFGGALFWQPIGNGERFVVLRSSPVAPRDNRVSVLTNWQARLR
jgi:Tol biopolymer transport system component/predicted Ser/Thr protein kinase